MHIKVPVGSSWQFIGNLSPPPTRKEKLSLLGKKQCPIIENLPNQATLKLVKTNVKGVKEGQTPPLQK